MLNAKNKWENVKKKSCTFLLRFVSSHKTFESITFFFDVAIFVC